MPLYLLPGTSATWTMQLTDNLGNTYTIRPRTLTIAIVDTAVASLADNVVTGVAIGTTKLRYSCTTLLGTQLSGEDDINVVSTLPREDATAMRPLYTPQTSPA